MFAKLRPGFEHFPAAAENVAIFPSGNTSITPLALGAGGILEFYVSPRLLLRYDFGDTVLWYRRRNVSFSQVTESIEGRTRNVVQFTPSIAYRFGRPAAGEGPLREASTEKSHAFWDKQNRLLLLGLGAARGVDMASTIHFRIKGINEGLLTNDVVDNHVALAAIEAGATGLLSGFRIYFIGQVIMCWVSEARRPS